MPYCLSLLISIVWSKVSFALDRSKNVEIGSLPLSSICSKASTNSRVAFQNVVFYSHAGFCVIIDSLAEQQPVGR